MDSTVHSIEEARERRTRREWDKLSTAAAALPPTHWRRSDSLSGISSYLERRQKAAEQRREDNAYVSRLYHLPVSGESK